MHPFFKALLDFIYPPRCYLCGISSEEPVCSSCTSALLFIEDPVCQKCGKPCVSPVDLHGASLVESCRECRARRFKFSLARSLGLYEDGFKEIVREFKYRGKKRLVPIFAEMMVSKVAPEFFEVDLVSFVPLTRKKKVRRGYNQSEILAQALAGSLDLPCGSTLVKNQETEDQSQLPAEERRKNVRGVFSSADGGVDLKGKTVLLVDDVLTTGTTVNECSKVLLKAGAKEIRVLTLARSTALV